MYLQTLKLYNTLQQMRDVG